MTGNLKEKLLSRIKSCVQIFTIMRSRPVLLGTRFLVLLLFEKEHMIFIVLIETFVVLSPSVFHTKPSNHNHRHIFVFFNILRVVGYLLLTSVISNGKKNSHQIALCTKWTGECVPYGPALWSRVL